MPNDRSLPTHRHLVAGARLAALLLALGSLLVAGCGSRAATRDEGAAKTEPVTPAAPAKPARDPCADLTIHFAADDPVVVDVDRAALAAFGDCARDSDRSVRVECHAGGVGTADQGFAEGQRLARAAARELGNRGVTPDQILLLSRGNAVPVCREDTPKCHRRNRRCELSL